MKPIKTLLIVSLLFFLASCSKQAPRREIAMSNDTAIASPATPGSIYAMPMTFDNQHGQPVEWQSLRGKVRVMAMVFTHCPDACPRTTEEIKNLQKLLPERSPVAYTLISFDSKRDTGATLAAFAALHNLDSNWQLLHGSAENVRTVANLLNVKYKEWPTGDFTHDNAIFIIDREGHVAVRHDGLGSDAKELSSKVISLCN
jgi:protein SCO1